MKEILRHELAHLFASYWALTVPRFLGEGLATWLQATWEKRPVDLQALSFLLGQKCVDVETLMSSSRFAAEGEYGYVLAGSFTGFLIRRFGWEAYANVYRAARKVSLAEAVRR